MSFFIAVTPALKHGCSHSKLVRTAEVQMTLKVTVVTTSNVETSQLVELVESAPVAYGEPLAKTDIQGR